MLADRAFWDARAAALGHTGWSDSNLYRYDQKVRLRAVERVLRRTGVWPRPGMRVLDVGCGTGDFARAFARAGAWVLGVDISCRVIDEARRRTGGVYGLQFCVAAIEELAVKPASFDLATAVTVLQHFVEDARLRRALEVLSSAVRPGGHVLTLELAPRYPREPDPRAPHVRVRDRGEWVRWFEEHGFTLCADSPYPQTAIVLMHRLGRRRAGEGPPRAGKRRETLRLVVRRAVLAACWVLDQGLGLAPPDALTLYRILLFRRQAT